MIDMVGINRNHVGRRHRGPHLVGQEEPVEVEVIEVDDCLEPEDAAKFELLKEAFGGAEIPQIHIRDLSEGDLVEILDHKCHSNLGNARCDICFAPIANLPGLTPPPRVVPQTTPVPDLAPPKEPVVRPPTPVPSFK